MVQTVIETRLMQKDHEKHDENTTWPCVDYGCPMHPIEVDPVMKNNDNDNRARAFLDASNRAHSFVAMMTRKSNRKNPPFNEDSAVALWPFRTAQTTHANDFLIGLFDGHGQHGHAMSQYAAREFPAILARRFNEHRTEPNANDDDWIRAALNASFVETDANAPPLQALLGGTTASVVLRRGSKLYLANAGDSRTIVVSAAPRKDAEIVYSTRLDKPHLEEERRRIEGVGGKVTVHNEDPVESYAWVDSEAEGRTAALAMSRSLGDWEWGGVGVTPEPIIDVLDLRNLSEHAFVLAASDGMWDARPSPHFFANVFAETYRQGQDPLRQCYQVIDEISLNNKTGYRDDITIVAAKLLGSKVASSIDADTDKSVDGPRPKRSRAK